MYQIIHSASKNGLHMDQYVTDVLFDGVERDKLINIVEAVRSKSLISIYMPLIFLHLIKQFL